MWLWRCQSGYWIISQGSFPNRRGDSRDDLAPQPAEPAWLGAGSDRGLCRAESLWQGQAPPEQWSLSLSRHGDTCHLRGTTFEAIGGRTDTLVPVQLPQMGWGCQKPWHNSCVGSHLLYHSWDQPGGSGSPKFSPPAVLQLMESLIEYELCLQWARIWKRGQSARLGSGKHLEALGQWLLCVQGSSSSTDMAFKLMRAETGVL